MPESRLFLRTAPSHGELHNRWEENLAVKTSPFYRAGAPENARFVPGNKTVRCRSPFLCPVPHASAPHRAVSAAIKREAKTSVCREPGFDLLVGGEAVKRLHDRAGGSHGQCFLDRGLLPLGWGHRRAAVATPETKMIRKAHSQQITDCGYPLTTAAHVMRVR